MRAMLDQLRRAGLESIHEKLQDGRRLDFEDGMHLYRTPDLTAVGYLANELGPAGIRVNALSAGPLKTLSSSAVGDFDMMVKLYGSMSPMRRNITPDEVGKVGMFLLSDQASNVPLPFPPSCALLVGGAPLLTGAFATGPGAPGSGVGTLVLPLPATASGLTLTAQCGVLEGGSLGSVRTTNGVRVTLQ